MDPQRKAPRWPRRLRFSADEGFSGQVLDVSAVGMRLKVTSSKLPAPSNRLWPGTLSLEIGAHVRIKVRVTRVASGGGGKEVGLEIAEADRAFYDALPKMRRDSGEVPKLDG